jgi:flavorubredoxin
MTQGRINTMVNLQWPEAFYTYVASSVFSDDKGKYICIQHDYLFSYFYSSFDCTKCFLLSNLIT